MTFVFRVRHRPFFVTPGESLPPSSLVWRGNRGTTNVDVTWAQGEVTLIFTYIRTYSKDELKTCTYTYITYDPIDFNSRKFTNQTPFNCHYYYPALNYFSSCTYSNCGGVLPGTDIRVENFHPVPKLSHLSEFESSGKSRSHYANHHKNPTTTQLPTTLLMIYTYISQQNIYMFPTSI